MLYQLSYLPERAKSRLARRQVNRCKTPRQPAARSHPRRPPRGRSNPHAARTPPAVRITPPDAIHTSQARRSAPTAKHARRPTCTPRNRARRTALLAARRRELEPPSSSHWRAGVPTAITHASTAITKARGDHPCERGNHSGHHTPRLPPSRPERSSPAAVCCAASFDIRQRNLPMRQGCHGGHELDEALAVRTRAGSRSQEPPSSQAITDFVRSSR